MFRMGAIARHAGEKKLLLSLLSIKRSSRSKKGGSDQLMTLELLSEALSIKAIPETLKTQRILLYAADFVVTKTITVTLWRMR